MRPIAFLTLEDRTAYVIDDALAIDELGRRGVKVDEIPWRRAGTDWRAYDGVVIRTTWDYQRDLGAFLGLLDELERMSIPLANRASLVRWNAHKTYLVDLAARRVPIVPTRWGRDMSAEDVRALPGSLGTAECVLKPAVGANAEDTYRLGAGIGEREANEIATRFAGREWMAQPFVSSIVRDGEVSLFYFAGIFSHAIVKRPKPLDFRVQEEHGASIEPWTVEEEASRAARAVLAALGEPPLQARIDLVRLDDGTLALMELEAIEPSLYFRMHEHAARNFADAVESWLEARADASDRPRR